MTLAESIRDYHDCIWLGRSMSHVWLLEMALPHLRHFKMRKVVYNGAKESEFRSAAEAMLHHHGWLKIQIDRWCSFMNSKTESEHKKQRTGGEDPDFSMSEIGVCMIESCLQQDLCRQGHMLQQKGTQRSSSTSSPHDYEVTKGRSLPVSKLCLDKILGISAACKRTCKQSTVFSNYWWKPSSNTALFAIPTLSSSTGHCNWDKEVPTELSSLSIKPQRIFLHRTDTAADIISFHHVNYTSHLTKTNNDAKRAPTMIWHASWNCLETKYLHTSPHSPFLHGNLRRDRLILFFFSASFG